MPRKPERSSEKPKGLPLPDATYQPGWPQQLTDTQGVNYWRVNDGEPWEQYNYKGGMAVHYAIIKEWDRSRPQVLGENMYVPTIDSKTTDNVTMSGGIWDDNVQLEDTFDIYESE